MRKIMKKVQAVSPVIATLMLVLVAVGAAGAFYLWQTGWQSGVENKAGTAEITETLDVGGSTTVYELTQYAKEMFEAKYPNFRINLQGGGSDSGIMGAGLGLCDIGCSSSSVDMEYFNLYPDLNDDGIKDLGIDLEIRKLCYDAVVPVVPKANTHHLIAVDDAWVKRVYTEGNTETWDAMPEAPGSLDNCIGSDAVNSYGRADGSGTEKTFAKYFLGDETNLPATIGGTNYEADFDATGNPALIAAIANDPNSFGFTSWGMYESNKDKLLEINAVEGSFNGTASIANIADGSYPQSRTLYLITAGEPKGSAAVFIDFLLDTQMNQELCELAAYVSLYENHP